MPLVDPRKTIGVLAIVAIIHILVGKYVFPIPEQTLVAVGLTYLFSIPTTVFLVEGICSSFRYMRGNYEQSIRIKARYVFVVYVVLSLVLAGCLETGLVFFPVYAFVAAIISFVLIILLLGLLG